MKHLSDDELMVRCVCGDRRAMDVLVSRYHSKLLDFAYRHLGDRETSADIAQTTLLRVFESAGSYQLKASFKTWLYTIALNAIRDEFRRRRVRKESPSAELDEAQPQATHDQGNAGKSPEDIALGRIAASAAWEAVDRLPENQKSAIILKFRHGLSYEEISAVMGAPSGTVKSWVHFALKTLRDFLEPAECEV